MLAMTTDVWSEFIWFSLIRLCQFFCNLQFVYPIPKTCMAGKVMGQGLFALFKSLDFDISVICVIYILCHNLQLILSHAM